ncbi:MAG: tyrosine-type recombinase/integrase [Candidatus Poribacteria bacterium]|nr:tyrosine-type recombinase/integrase [Candidatus Poribacteria bacterium]
MGDDTRVLVVQQIGEQVEVVAAEITATLRETLTSIKPADAVPQDRVFSYHGKPLRSNVTTTFKKIVGKAGLENITLRTLRHTFASHLAMRGVPLMHIQQLMGHQDYKTTLIYAHLSTESHKGQVHHLPFADNIDDIRS